MEGRAGGGNTKTETVGKGGFVLKQKRKVHAKALNTAHARKFSRFEAKRTTKTHRQTLFRRLGKSLFSFDTHKF